MTRVQSQWKKHRIIGVSSGLRCLFVVGFFFTMHVAGQKMNDTGSILMKVVVGFFFTLRIVGQIWMTRVQSQWKKQHIIGVSGGLRCLFVCCCCWVFLYPARCWSENEWHGFNPNESNNGPLVYQVVWDVCLFLPVFSLPCTLLVGNEWHKFGPNEGKKVSVTFEHLASKPHKTKIILDFKTKRLWSKHIL